jgi:BirA family transcriptional regulator, biotin operon repressor / biotin---[acetyl-CoA-carboxylase] ligase
MGIDTPRAPLDQSRITSALSRYWRVSVVDLTASTQDDLVNKVNAGDAKSGDVIVANYQSAGRGRLDRTFLAPPSTALLFSLYLHPKRSRDDWGFIPLLAGYSIADTLRKVNAHVSIKWPNDLLIDEMKLGGIIATATGSGVVVGIGINVSMTVDELPVETATSLTVAGVSKIDRNFLLPLLLNAFENDFLAWDQGESFLDKYSQLSATHGREVTVSGPAESTIHSRAESFDEQGRLHLEDGQIVTVGDVIHLR